MVIIHHNQYRYSNFKFEFLYRNFIQMILIQIKRYFILSPLHIQHFQFPQ